jgi:hypothetical protein
MKKLLAAYGTMVGDLQKAAKQFAGPTTWTPHGEASPDRVAGPERLLSVSHD